MSPMRRSLSITAILCITCSGCIESTFTVPYPPDEQPSRLWRADPRTVGWDDVEVVYYFTTYHGLEAHVQSKNDKYEFIQPVEFWYETEPNCPSFYLPDKIPHYTVVSYNGVMERYLYTFVSMTAGRTARFVFLVQKTGPTTKPDASFIHSPH